MLLGKTQLSAEVSASLGDLFAGSRRTVEVFVKLCELYLHKSVNKLIEIARRTIEDFVDSFRSVTKAIFVIFLLYEILILLYMRRILIRVMRDDVFLSRGILNLIPEQFFAENRESVEGIIIKLKN